MISVLDNEFINAIDRLDIGWYPLLSGDGGLSKWMIDELADCGYSAQQAEEYFTAIKSTPLEQLIENAIEEDSDDTPALGALQSSKSRDVFEKAKVLCGSDTAKERVVGVEVLMRGPGLTYRDEAIETLLSLSAMEQSAPVLEVLALALSHLEVPDRVKYLAKAVKSDRSETRMGAAYSLCGLNDDEAVKYLVTLSCDEDDEVRNWATFGLGRMADSDTLAIRQALFERINDSDDEVRHEAIYGLAKRHDERVLDMLIELLTSGEAWELDVEAAKEMGHPLLYPHLVALSQTWKDCFWIDEAISTCRPQ